uniref:Transposase (Putative), gypsy type n=1 Tax=Tanacetum cinerariifolium TaxID=118510 RepID=A0A6L2KE90_TANCI|nr:transposase (putative), gypsy type [Tanacetum cinerariifolium]
MSFSKRPEKNTPQCYTKPLDSLKNWNNRFFWVDERVFPTIVDWRTSAPKDGMPAENTYSPEAVMILNTHRTPIQKQPEALLCLVGLSRIYYLGDEVYPTFLHDDDRGGLIRPPNPTKVKTGSRPRAAHEVSLLTVTANRVIKMEDLTAATDSSRVPSTIERSSLDFANENPSQQSTGPEDQEAAAPEMPPPENVTTTRVAPEVGQAERVATTGPPVVKERRKRGHDGVDTNAPPKVLRRDHADPRPTESTRRGKSLAAIELGMGSTRLVSASQGTPVDVSDPDPLSFVDPQSRPSTDVTQSSKGAVAARDPKSENTSFTSMVGSRETIYRPEWGITNGFLLDAHEACQDLVDHIAPQGYFLELRHLHNDDFFKAIQCKLGTTSGNGVAAVVKQVSTIQEQVMREKKLKAAFKEFEQYEDNRVEQRCAKMDARLDALSIDFDEELYPHMLTAIAGRRWVIGRGLRLAMMKSNESTELRQAFADVVSAGIAKGMSEGLKHGKAIEAYDPEAEAKYIAALHALKNLKYPPVDQLESLKDAPMDVIMASLHPESDTGDDAPQWIRELRPSSSQPTIPVYPEARDPMDHWASKEEILLADVIAANVSRAEKKKKCRVVCRTHRVGSTHHARSDGVLVSMPTIAPQGLAILLADVATQTEISEDEASPRLLGRAPCLLCIVESIHSTACGTLNILYLYISTDVRDKHCM